MKGDIETVKHGEAWINRLQGSYTTQAEAAAVGIAAAKILKVEWVQRSLDGTISKRNSYGNDPRDVKG